MRVCILSTACSPPLFNTPKPPRLREQRSNTSRYPTLSNPPHILHKLPTNNLLPTLPINWTMFIWIVEWILQESDICCLHRFEYLFPLLAFSLQSFLSPLSFSISLLSSPSPCQSARKQNSKLTLRISPSLTPAPATPPSAFPFPPFPPPFPPIFLTALPLPSTKTTNLTPVFVSNPYAANLSSTAYSNPKSPVKLLPEMRLRESNISSVELSRSEYWRGVRRDS